jgi:hypothetical protein
MPTSDWTERGCRAIAELSNLMIIMTCQSQAVSREVETVGRVTWNLSQLGIPALTPRAEAERLVNHWLAFYGDPTLSERGLSVFREVFCSLPEHAPPSGGSGQSNLN